MGTGGGKVKLKCPVCGDRQTLDSLLNVLPPLQNATWWTSERLMENLRTGEIKWACENCLEAGRAIRGDPAKQKFGIGAPFYAYYDVMLRCTDCGQSFTFSAEDQRFWYEHLRFIIYAYPKQCLPCRRKRRDRNQASAELSSILQKLDHRNPQELIRVAELYQRMGIKRKSLEYMRRAKNLVRDPELVRALLAKIVELERST